ncbi:hypothetical protein [Streptomyces sp. NPDC088746]|uniref:hypothetical protein n=1 Tax=Streptomyces sp. NPDC088746 TaxID=3365885 RepID=UPI00381454DD
MSPFKATVTPEQQAATQARVTEVWAPFTAAMQAAGPVMAHAAREACASLARVAAPAGADPAASPRP